MTNAIFLAGLLSSCILVLGSAWPDPPTHIKPIHTFKHRIFALGNLGMFAYALLRFFHQENPFFFVLLEILCVFSSLLMLLSVKEKISTTLILIAGTALLTWAFFLFEDHTTLIFILALTLLALAFISRNEKKRNSLFLLGCILLATFSFIENDFIYFWLNVVFGLFSSFYLLKAFQKR